MIKEHLQVSKGDSGHPDTMCRNLPMFTYYKQLYSVIQYYQQWQQQPQPQQPQPPLFSTLKTENTKPSIVLGKRKYPEPKIAPVHKNIPSKFLSEPLNADKVTHKPVGKPASSSSSSSSSSSGINISDITSLPASSINSIRCVVSGNYSPSKLIASFDMDHTLIRPQSGRAFPISASDWEWAFDSVPKKLKKLHEDGYRIIIFTNQGGIVKGKTRQSDIETKIMDIASKLGIPLLAIFCVNSDANMSKPGTGMWKYFTSTYNKGVPVDMKLSFFVGDAAGRPADPTKKKKKDFSCSDRKFAFNIGIPFLTETEFFLNSPKEDFSWDSFVPFDTKSEGSKMLTQRELIIKQLNFSKPRLEIVLLVGPPASGKSTLTKKYLIPNGYTWINRDTLGTVQKCIDKAREILREKKSVAIDNTNPSAESRKPFLALAEEFDVPIRCLVLQTGYEIASHLNKLRGKSGGPVVPDIAYNMFKKNFQMPSIAEGFSTVVQIPFAPSFNSEQEERLFNELT
eukprot:TRINITY_DN331_c0_g1_i2.p1 TRINITY_DN331_c0_g1~~TRINITY_DN331_c0_g1_i2.p1  ORF type:complete len:511 (-),score=124.21 TRINITY_DN331_c0_g1_i2:123-1655(-)